MHKSLSLTHSTRAKGLSESRVLYRHVLSNGLIPILTGVVVILPSLFIGSLIVIISFSLLMIRLLKVANEARTDFESLIVIGITTMLMFQVVVNICMTIGLGPVTGIPLPFMSYGRTALFVNFLSLGLCLSVSRRGLSSFNRTR